MPYIRVTENGSARILFSELENGNINGLCITDLTTCTGIVIVGTKGIAVVHDEGFLDIESIKKEFEYVGDLVEWRICYNPNELKEKELEGRKREMLPLVDLYGKKLKKKPRHGGFFPTLSGKLIAYRDKKGGFGFNTAPGNDIEYYDPKELNARTATRLLNNICGHHLKRNGHTITHRIVPVDVQFDEGRQTACPSLVRAHEEVEEIVKAEFNPQMAKNQRGYQMQIVGLGEYSGYLNYLKEIFQAPAEEQAHSAGEAKENRPPAQKQPPKYIQSQCTFLPSYRPLDPAPIKIHSLFTQEGLQIDFFSFGENIFAKPREGNPIQEENIFLDHHIDGGLSQEGVGGLGLTVKQKIQAIRQAGDISISESASGHVEIHVTTNLFTPEKPLAPS